MFARCLCDWITNLDLTIWLRSLLSLSLYFFLLSSTTTEWHITTEAIGVCGISDVLGNTPPPSLPADTHFSPASYLWFLPLLGIWEDWVSEETYSVALRYLRQRAVEAIKKKKKINAFLIGQEPVDVKYQGSYKVPDVLKFGSLKFFSVKPWKSPFLYSDA